VNLISSCVLQLKNMDRDTHSCRSGLNDLCSSRSFGGTSHEQERLESIGSFGHFRIREIRTLLVEWYPRVSDHHEVLESLKAGFVIFRSTPRCRSVIGKSKLKHLLYLHPPVLG
jgi:hypothetical protein